MACIRLVNPACISLYAGRSSGGTFERSKNDSSCCAPGPGSTGCPVALLASAAGACPSTGVGAVSGVPVGAVWTKLKISLVRVRGVAYRFLFDVVFADVEQVFRGVLRDVSKGQVRYRLVVFPEFSAEKADDFHRDRRVSLDQQADCG